MRGFLDFLDLIFEILLLIVALPIILISAILIGIFYIIYCIYEFIKTFVFNK